MSEPHCKDLEAAAGRLAGAMKFSEIPGTSKLFNDFLYDYDKVRDFYTEYGRATSPLADHAKEIGAGSYDRKRVPDALERINRNAGSSDLTFQHIEMLRHPGSVAIVTGQQAGLFTGPLYTIHKAITVVKLAACLREQGVEAVPVFWIASEDHDFAEVDHCAVVDQNGQVKSIRYRPAEACSDVPVGQILLDEGIAEAIKEMIALLPPSEFIAELERDLTECYSAGTGFAEAFAKLMARLFQNYGVILLDPLDDELKQVAGPLYVEALEKSEQIAQALLDRGADLEKAGYHAQIHISRDMVPLFILDNGRRSALVRRDDRYFVKGTGRSFAHDELISLATRCSNCFSPNVTFRPVVQDYLLPTAAYIGGPAEVAYFAQVRSVYEVLGRPLPCVLPRASFTIVEGRHQKTMLKYDLRLQDFFGGLHAAVTKVVEQSMDRETTEAFSETERVINEKLDILDTNLSRTDSTLAASVKTAREKILYHIDHLRTKFVHSSARRDETTYRKVERAFTTLYPNKNLQERELNAFYMLSRYGPRLLDELYEAAEIGYSNHKFVYIGGASPEAEK